MRNGILAGAVVFTAAILFNACGGSGQTVGSDDGGADAGDESSLLDGASGDGGLLCSGANVACIAGSECCSGKCDPATKACTSPIGSCGAGGAACKVPTDCCGLTCISGACGAACISDNQACTTGASCCGGNCTGGKCVPLSGTCKTAGNTCTSNSNCCSSLCGPGGTCTLAASYCIQTGDVCANAADCCGGLCNKATGATVGLCGAPSSSGSACTGGVDGTVCSGCGNCCSRLCAPYAPTGVNICQPANGCHINGDLCRTALDCCGGDPSSGLPAPTMPTVCSRTNPTDPVGICVNPSGCDPEGNVCHYKDNGYACNVVSSMRADCCGSPGAMSGACELDAVGVPRCHVVGSDAGGALPCVNTGGACAFNGDCCNGELCLPDPLTGKLHCGASGTTCSPSTGPCTVTADCCSGYTCNVPTGSVVGTCGGGTGTGGDAGSDGGVLSCSQYGQMCPPTCCNGVPCISGTCHYPL